MSSTFNQQILVEKLAKLNVSQQSIETLSHWCIFHMNKAKQVVETWDTQFHHSPPEQRLAFLYLANDILQNSRRKGSEFVGEFWKVLPDALRDVIEHGDGFGRNAAMRMIGIWEERKVFGSRGQILKEELMGRQLENNIKNGKQPGLKPKQTLGNSVDKIVSGYQILYGGQLDEEVILSKCGNAINFVDKVDKEITGDMSSGKLYGSERVVELQGQHGVLRDCIEQLAAVESARATLVSHLREALQDQEYKLDQVRNQLQAAQAHSGQASNICRQLLNSNNMRQPQSDQGLKEPPASKAPCSLMAKDVEQSAPVMYAHQMPYMEKSSHNEDDARKSAAAAVAAKLTASTSSAQMLTYVLSSLASEGVIGNSIKESSGDYPPEKRSKLENDQSGYVPMPAQTPQLNSLAPFGHAETLQHNVTTTSQAASSEQPPHPSAAPLPLLPPAPPYTEPQFAPGAGSIPNVSYGYGTNQLQPPSLPGYPTVGAVPVTGMSPYNAPPTNPYQGFPVPEGGFYTQQSSLPMAPMSRQ